MTVEAAPTASGDPSPGTDLLTSKFVPSSLAQGTTERRRLLDACSSATQKRLTVVDGPVGYGKTTLLAEWYREQMGTGEGIVAWLSLERAENDPALFWRYVVESLRWAGFTGGARAAEILRVPGADVGAAVRSLLNDLGAARQRIVLILDDYHVVDEPACHELVAYLLEHSPQGFRLILATRSDPPLPLASLRAAGQLAEIRTADLRLTPEEAADFVRVGEGLPLDDDELALLTGRTEGWVAALHLAALWLRGEADRRTAIVEFAGDHRHLVDYLGEQVLAGLDPEIERFLLETSILSRFTAPLCDAVTGTSGAAESLAEIERANLFLVPLDGRRRWYRYHHLFGGLLQAELSRREPDLVPVLHERAYAWHREHGTVPEAVHHATLAGDYPAAADEITGSWITLIRSGRSATIQRWLRRFPDAAIADAPELAYVGAFVAGLAGAAESEVDEWLRVAEKSAVAAQTPGDRLPDGTTSFEVNLNIIRAAFVYRDVEAAVAIAQRVVAEESGGGQWRVPAFATLGFLRHISGDADAARAAVSEALDDRDAPRRPHGVIQALATQSLLELDDGESEKAQRTAQRALEVADSVGLAKSVTAGLAYVALGRGLVALGGPAEGGRELAIATELLEGRAPITHHLYALVQLAEAQRVSGDLIAAHRSVDEAELLIETFTDAGIFPTMLAGVRDRLRLMRRRRPAAPGAELTESELAVLRLLAGPQSRREIAEELGVSANTVKTHTSSVYRKLGVGSRAEAVLKAGELKLI